MKKELKQKFTKKVENSNMNFHNFNELPEFIGKLAGTKILNIEGEAIEFLTAADMETGEVVLLPRNVDLMRKLQTLSVGTEFLAEYIGEEKIPGTRKTIKRFQVCIAE